LQAPVAAWARFRYAEPMTTIEQSKRPLSLNDGGERTDKQLIEFIVMCVDEFSHAKEMSVKDAFFYLNAHKGIAFLQEHYDIEHTLPPDMTLEALTVVCKRNGGAIE
jgi:hypothetical protein